VSLFFSNTAEIVSPLTSRLYRITDALMNIQAGRYTNLGDGIRKARGLLLKDNFLNKKILIIISDGLPNITSDGALSPHDLLHESPEMDTFTLSFGVEGGNHCKDAQGAESGDVRLMFMNLIGSDYASKEAKKALKQHIEINFLYVGDPNKRGESYAREIAHLGGGVFYRIDRFSNLPDKTLQII